MLTGGALWVAPAITSVNRAAASHASGVTFQSLQYRVTRTANAECSVVAMSLTTADAGCQPTNFAVNQSTATNAAAASLSVTSCVQDSGSGDKAATVTFTIGSASTSCHFVSGNPPKARDLEGITSGACTTGTVAAGTNPKTAVSVAQLDRGAGNGVFPAESAIIRLVISCP